MGTRRGTEEEGKKITTEELIKCLRNCSSYDVQCTPCPFNENYENLNCVDDLMKAVADRLDEMMASEMGDLVRENESLAKSVIEASEILRKRENNG